MADCSYARCVQERRMIKRELLKWTKNMVNVVGEYIQIISSVKLGFDNTKKKLSLLRSENALHDSPLGNRTFKFFVIYSLH
jgi:hypothetical protein